MFDKTRNTGIEGFYECSNASTRHCTRANDLIDA